MRAIEGVAYVLGTAILSGYVPVYLDRLVNVTLCRVAVVSVAVIGLAFLVHRPTISITAGDVAIPFPTSLSGIDPETIGRNRVAMYVLIVDLLPGHWLVGIGYGSFQSVMVTIHREGFVVHNLFLRVWLGAGIFAVLVFGKVLFRAARGFVTQARRSAGSAEGVRSLSFGVSLLALVLMGMFNPILTSPVFVTLLALGCSMPTENRRDFSVGRALLRRVANERSDGGT